jgi:hypothetical protein
MKRDPRRLAARVALLVAGACSLAGCRALRPEPPQAAFETTERDLGTIPAWEKAEARFPLRNTGGAILHLLDVHGECGCLTPEYPRQLAPGQAGEIRVTFEPQPTWHGKMEKHVRVKTDDPRRGEIALTLKAEVTPLIAIEPQNPVVLLYRRGAVERREVRLIPRPGSGTTLSSPTTDSPAVKATLDPPVPGDPRRAYRLQLVIGPYDRPGDLQSTVQVATTEPRLPLVPVSVVAQAPAGPVISPLRLYLPSLRADEAGKALSHLQVFTRSGRLRLLGVETGDPALSADIKESTPGRYYDVTLRYTGGWKAGRVGGNLRLRTDDPRDPVMVVPFSGIVH